MRLTVIINMLETFTELTLQKLGSMTALLPFSVVSYQVYYPYLNPELIFIPSS